MMRRETLFGGLKNSSDIRNAADSTQKIFVSIYSTISAWGRVQSSFVCAFIYPTLQKSFIIRLR
jgi:hypothetical protein